MIRLSEPSYNFDQVIDFCISGVTGNAVLKQNVEVGKGDLLAEGERYQFSSRGGELYLIEPLDTVNSSDPVVIGGLKKSDLVRLYEVYFVPEEKPAREIYDALMNAAMESCPFCGGIGTPRNLDHFLPKAHFPQFSIFPKNLVPSCRDCNMDGKAALFATQADCQIIQPYLDKDNFFLDQWIFAEYESSEGAPGVFKYFVKPPEGWIETDKRRAVKHFEDFDLSRRYRVRAAQGLNITMAQINSLRVKGLSNEIIRETILLPGADNALFPNHWQRGFYQALAEYLT